MDYDGENYMELLTDIDTPRGVVLNPNTRTVYFSSWSSDPFISKARYSGRIEEVLVSTDLIKPSGLAIHLEENKLFWCEMESVSAIYLNGSGRQIIYQKTSLFESLRFFELSLYHNVILVSDWETRVVYAMSKAPGQNLIPLISLQKASVEEPARPNGMAQICVPVNETLVSSTETEHEATAPYVVTTTVRTPTDAHSFLTSAQDARQTLQATLGSTTISSNSPHFVAQSEPTTADVPTSAPTPEGSLTSAQIPREKNEGRKNNNKGENDGVGGSTIIIIGISIAGALIAITIVAVTAYCCVKACRNDVPQINAQQSVEFPQVATPNSPPPYSVYMHRVDKTGMLDPTYQGQVDDKAVDNGTYLHARSRESGVYMSVELDE